MDLDPRVFALVLKLKMMQRGRRFALCPTFNKNRTWSLIVFERFTSEVLSRNTEREGIGVNASNLIVLKEMAAKIW